jgi:UDP-glucose 4-epimerase
VSSADTSPRRGTAFVTGAAGFIGSHLVQRLLLGGWKVRGLDNFSSGRADHLRGVAGSAELDLVEGSVLDECLVGRLTAGADRVFHLAGKLGPTFVEQHPEQTALETVWGARSVLAAAAEHRTPVFFASTSEIYGDSPLQPLVESADLIVAPPANPRSSYALGKAMAELLFNQHAASGRGPVVIGRLFNTVGPRQSGAYGQVLPRFVHHARANEPLTVHGTGAQTRSFTDVNDAVHAIDALLVPRAYGHTVNIGSSAEISISDLSRLVLKLTGSSSAVRHVPYESAHGRDARDIRRRVPDTTKLYELARCVCATPLEATIRAIFEHDARHS